MKTSGVPNHTESMRPGGKQHQKEESLNVRRWDGYTFTAAAVLFIGIVLRLHPYLINRAFWLDEASIALNIRFRTFAELFRPLDYEQTMPIPLLLFIKLLTVLFGASEYVFRFPALLAGIGLLVVIWLSFSELLGKVPALIALSLMAFFQPLVYYSSELKQYGIDAFVTAVLLWVGLRALKNPARDGKQLLSLAVVGSVAVLISQPSIFILASLGLAAMIDPRFWKSKEWRWPLMITFVVWVGLFAVVFFGSYSNTSHSDFMRHYWAENFIAPGSPLFFSQVKTMLHTIVGADAFRYMRLPIALPVFLLGAYGIFRSEKQLFVVAVLPFCLLFLASVLQQYPYAVRLYLFTIPLVAWIVSSGLIVLSRIFPKRFQPAAMLILAIAWLGNLAIPAYAYSVAPPLRETTRQAVAYMKRVDSHAPIYLTFGKYRTWSYYSGDWQKPAAVKKNLDQIEACLSCEWVIARKGHLEIIGKRPSLDSLDSYWAKHEIARIKTATSDHIWIYLPLYEDRFQPKKRWETLKGELREHGFVIEKTYSLGDSTALYYRMPTN